MRAALALVALLALAAGCLDAPAPGAPVSPPTPPPEERPPAEEWLLSGSFTAERSDADVEAVCRAGTGHATCALLKSFPEQFVFRFASGAACEEARVAIFAVPNTRVDACRGPETRSPPEAPKTPTWSPEPPGPEARVLDVRTFALTWWNGEPTSKKHEMSWDVVRAWEETGVVTIQTTTQGIEGGDFRFDLRYRASHPQGDVMFHEEGAAQKGTFDFAYTEAVFWSGRPVERVESVDRSSYVRVVQDLEAGNVQGTFFLDFVGACPGCGDYDKPQRTVLEGRFS